jgi:hypothetical protein
MSEIKFNIPEPIRRQPRVKEVVKKVKDERAKVFKHLMYALFWWVASCAVIYFVLESTTSMYFFTGLFGSVYQWKNAIKVYEANRSARSKKYFLKEFVAIISTVAIVVGSVIIILPEAVKVYSPRVGTCWAKTDSGYVAVACWGSNAAYKTSALVVGENGCPAGTVATLQPDEQESTYTCLITH